MPFSGQQGGEKMAACCEAADFICKIQLKLFLLNFPGFISASVSLIFLLINITFFLFTLFKTFQCQTSSALYMGWWHYTRYNNITNKNVIKMLFFITLFVLLTIVKRPRTSNTEV